MPRIGHVSMVLQLQPALAEETISMSVYKISDLTLSTTPVVHFSFSPRIFPSFSSLLPSSTALISPSTLSRLLEMQEFCIQRVPGCGKPTPQNAAHTFLDNNTQINAAHCQKH